MSTTLERVPTKRRNDFARLTRTCSMTALWALYMSFVNVGSTFYGFGWEMLLLETGFLAIFLGPTRSAPPIVSICTPR